MASARQELPPAAAAPQLEQASDKPDKKKKGLKKLASKVCA